MIEEMIFLFMIWVIGEIQYMKWRLKKGAEVMTYLNHKTTAIEEKLKDCGIVLLDQDDFPPP